MGSEIVQAIRNELDKLSIKKYREEQQVFADAKQLRHLRSILERASALQKEAVSDFSRCVNDVASSKSKLSQFTLELYQKSVS